MPEEMLSRDSAACTLALVDAFNLAINAHDVVQVMALMSQDRVFDSTRPPPDGERHIAQAAVRAFWEAFFLRSAQARFEPEEIFACGERATVRWVYHWVRDGQPGHIRGVDVFRISDALICPT